MKAHSRRWYDALAMIALALYLLMPVWGYLIFLQLVPAAPLSVVFGAMMLVVLVFRGYGWLKWRWRLPSGNYALLWLLLVWVTLLQLYWGPKTIFQAAPGMYLMTVAFTIGAYLFLLGGEVAAFHLVSQTEMTVWVWRGVVLIFILLLLTVTVGVGFSLAISHKFLFYFVRRHPRSVYNYQLLSDTIAFFSLLVMARYGPRGLSRSVGLYVITAFALFTAYSRATLLVYLIVGGVFVLMLAWPDARQRRLLLGMMAAGLILGLLAIVFVRTRIDSNSVLSVIWGRYFSAQSFWTDFWEPRLRLWNQSMPFLRRYWLWGRFMYEAIVFEAGDYIHNWVSFWLAYGIVPFALSLYLLSATLVAAVRGMRSHPWARLAFVLILYNVLMITLARAYVWRFFWLTLALPIALLAFSTNHDVGKSSSLSPALE